MKTVEDVQKEIHESVYGPDVSDDMPSVFLCGRARLMAMYYFDRGGFLIKIEPRGILDNVGKITVSVPDDVEVETQRFGVKE